MSNAKTRVVVAMSGGVDSSVAAYLLKKDGYDVLGVFMKNWHDTNVTISKECPWLEDSYDAMLVAEKLSIPFQVIDLSKDYKKKIVDYMFEEYKNGRTPNPDILCNREIKFDLFLDIAIKLGADYIATGHYAQVTESKKSNKSLFHLKSGKDKSKDQSYFLCQLNQFQLSKTIFPIGKINKKDVRKIAKKNNLITADKKDSQGLCFIGKVKLPDFLQQSLKPKNGNVVLIDKSYYGYKSYSNPKGIKITSKKIKYNKSDGEIIGHHNGAHFYTIGQRQGLKIGGVKSGNGEPWFVIKKDFKTNELVVGQGHNHPALLKDGLVASGMHWIKGMHPKENWVYSAKTRYRQPDAPCEIDNLKDEQATIIFGQKQWAVTPGQSVVIYESNICLGGGFIKEAIDQ